MEGLLNVDSWFYRGVSIQMGGVFIKSLHMVDPSRKLSHRPVAVLVSAMLLGRSPVLPPSKRAQYNPDLTTSRAEHFCRVSCCIWTV